jgi:hypothetical protein
MFLVPHSRDSSCIGGIYSHYYAEFPDDILGKYMSRDQFVQVLDIVNDTLAMYWPCTLASTLAWVCALPTLGLACWAQRICMYDAEVEIHVKLAAVNRKLEIQQCPVRWRFSKSCMDSWVRFNRV